LRTDVAAWYAYASDDDDRLTAKTIVHVCETKHAGEGRRRRPVVTAASAARTTP
jgi:hypothetical protein